MFSTGSWHTSDGGLQKLRATRRRWGFSRSRLATVVVALVWSVGSSLWIYPHSLSYFNESIGGPENGQGHLLGSNLDWEQDLRYLKWWLDEHPEATPLYVYVSHVGFYDPNYLGIVCVQIQGVRGSVKEQKETRRSWSAISVNQLRNSQWVAFKGKRMEERDCPRPFAGIGYTLVLVQPDF